MITAYWPHQILYKHTKLEKNGAMLMICHRRFSRYSYVYYRPWEGAMWEEADDLDALKDRMSKV